MLVVENVASQIRGRTCSTTSVSVEEFGNGRSYGTETETRAPTQGFLHGLEHVLIRDDPIDPTAVAPRSSKDLGSKG